ncbi:MAG TPA: efflux RND transporter periplasmic adaptor subunit [Roseiarcus sp.]|nr:efflux RND transporter periplasmic adaptor subunit [Roseiarcus sp.]
MNQRRRPILLAAALCVASWSASAQQPPGRPPAVGVVPVAMRPVTPSSEYVGRIQAVDRVNLVARVSAFLEQRFFTEGADVKKGDLLYRLEQGPFQADVEAKQAVVAQYKAQLRNADLTLQRAKTLLNTPAGQQSTVDAALANQLSLQAQMQGAEAQLEQSKLNLGYTEIRAPIDGKIGRTSVTVGNYVTPNSGVLATIVSQDPIYVVFPVATRQAIALMEKVAKKGGFHSLVVKVRLPDGALYDQTGKLDFLDNTVSSNTDTIALRAVLANPALPSAKGDLTTRRLVDGEFVTVILEDAQPVEALTVPRAAVLTDQGGDYVYVVGEDNKAQQRRVELGASSPAPTLAVVASGLSEGDSVVVDGIQRIRPGETVSPAPATVEEGAATRAAPVAAPTARQ